MAPTLSSMIVAIDGPAASGKSTVARLLGERLGVPLLNTGAMYRAVGLACLDAGLDLEDAAACEARANSLDLDVTSVGVVTVDGQPVAVEREEAGSAASRVAVHPGVRARLVALQQEFGRRYGCVAEGRDTTTVVFPDADVRVFLAASPRIRAERRARQEGAPERAEEYAREIAARDERDASRAVAPLRPAPGALRLSSDEATPEQLVERIAQAVEEACP